MRRMWGDPYTDLMSLHTPLTTPRVMLTTIKLVYAPELWRLRTRWSSSLNAAITRYRAHWIAWVTGMGFSPLALATHDTEALHGRSSTIHLCPIRPFVVAVAARHLSAEVAVARACDSGDQRSQVKSN